MKILTQILTAFVILFSISACEIYDHYYYRQNIHQEWRSVNESNGVFLYFLNDSINSTPNDGKHYPDHLKMMRDHSYLSLFIEEHRRKIIGKDSLIQDTPEITIAIISHHDKINFSFRKIKLEINGVPAISPDTSYEYLMKHDTSGNQYDVWSSNDDSTKIQNHKKVKFEKNFKIFKYADYFDFDAVKSFHERSICWKLKESSDTIRTIKIEFDSITINDVKKPVPPLQFIRDKERVTNIPMLR